MAFLGDAGEQTREMQQDGWGKSVGWGSRPDAWALGDAEKLLWESQVQISDGAGL